MKTFRNISIFCFLIFSALSLKAQNPEPTFFIVETMKATHNNAAAYVKSEVELWKKIHQERIKRGYITAWSFYSVKYPSGSDVAYDFITVTTVQGFNKLENTYGNLLSEGEKVFGKEMATKAMAIGSLRDLTTSSVFYGMDFLQADPKSTKQAKYLVVNYMKVKDGKYEEYENFERKLIKPIHVEMMKNGGRSAWGMYQKVMPRGEAQPFDFTTVDFYDTWADMNNQQSYRKVHEKVNPEMSWERMNKIMNDSRTLTQSEVWELISTTN
ncbi:hypothetical protein SAMN06298216_0213 [Spirosomataceae bacterium TFI 002]|nr:hypothetical protein SAMN06298216_0213 [Spirosomataceae bacterium TFI 002]